jgi:hypothetical protein
LVRRSPAAARRTGPASPPGRPGRPPATLTNGRTLGADIGILRIFNAYAPPMRTGNGKVVTGPIIRGRNRDPPA